MLRVIQNRDSQAAKGYYASRAEGGYYLGAEQEAVGSWGGSGAERLGLYGAIDRRSFDRLCDNRHPATGERLTVRTRKDRTPGYDVNFHACKSASLLYALTNDPAILRAFRDAVADTMREMEERMQTRVRTRGRSRDRRAGNLVYGEFLHFTARPVAGVIDPHLHAHCFVFNAVFDPVEHRWKAGQFRDLKASAPGFERAFHARFAWKLAALGYPIERQNDRWEIAGVERALIEKFSHRTRQIDAFAQAHGITDPKEKDGIGARTRCRKQPETGMAELRRGWRARLSEEERQALNGAALRADFFTGQAVPEDARLTAWRWERLAFARQRQRVRTAGDGPSPALLR